MHEEHWGRKGLRSNGSEFTVLTFAQYFLHDVVHHLHDVNGWELAAASAVGATGSLSQAMLRLTAT